MPPAITLISALAARRPRFWLASRAWLRRACMQDANGDDDVDQASPVKYWRGASRQEGLSDELQHHDERS